MMTKEGIGISERVKNVAELMIDIALESNMLLTYGEVETILFPFQLTREEAENACYFAEANGVRFVENREPTNADLDKVESELTEEMSKYNGTPQLEVKEGSSPKESGDKYAEDPIRAYFRDIGKKQLLSPDEELKYAKAASKGDKAARDALIEHNTRLAVSIAKKYTNRGMPLLDLIQDRMNSKGANNMTREQII